MKTANWPIPPADAYGGVLLTRTGQVLLREPANHFGGYVWTFAKGKPKPGETPEETALTEVLEETGYQAEVVDVLPEVFNSGLSKTAFFVMRHLGPPAAFEWETQAIRWVDFDTAKTLIQHTTNAKGRARDLAILAAARAWFAENKTVVLPDGERDQGKPVQKSDWRTDNMPRKHTRIALDFTLNPAQATRLKLGFLPSCMEEKWFVYFDHNILYQHRSWTGYCIDQIHFVADGDGLRATHAVVNRDPEQYTETDDARDAARIEAMVFDWAGGVR